MESAEQPPTGQREDAPPRPATAGSRETPHPRVGGPSSKMQVSPASPASLPRPSPCAAPCSAQGRLRAAPARGGEAQRGALIGGGGEVGALPSPNHPPIYPVPSRVSADHKPGLLGSSSLRRANNPRPLAPRSTFHRRLAVPRAMDIGATTLILLVICVSCLLLFLNGKGQKNRGHLPPGPRPLPLLGNLLQLDTKDMIKSLLTLSKRYGPVFTIHLGPQPWVVLCGYQVVKEALVDQAEEFSARGDQPVFFRFTQGNGISFSNGEKWKVLRRFALQTLRDFGMGKRSLEQRIQEEARCLVQELAQTQAAPFDPTFLISRAVSNVICSIVFGNRFDYEDRNFLILVGLIHQIFQLLSSPWGQIYNLFPGPMSYLPGPHNRIFENFEQLRLFVSERVKMHQESFDPNCPSDFIDCFLLRMEQENQDPLSYFHMETLVMTTHNLLFGGTETVSTTLRYGFLILMKFPEIQAKVHTEIDQVIGRHRSPSVEDRAHMPYTDAMIHEVQRFSDVVPMGAPHAVTRDTQFRGFLLPEGTNVIPLLFSVHKDPTQFQDPATFDPAHFLDERGGFRKNDAFMAFSAGKRICLGEGMARMELFLFFTAILQRFTLTSLTRPEEIDISPLMSGLGTVPRPYEFRAVPR